MFFYFTRFTLTLITSRLEVDLSSQQLALDIQVVITSVSNVMCWKHWRDIIYPNRWVFCFQRNWRKRSTGGNYSFRCLITTLSPSLLGLPIFSTILIIVTTSHQEILFSQPILVQSSISVYDISQDSFSWCFGPQISFKLVLKVQNIELRICINFKINQLTIISSRKVS